MSFFVVVVVISVGVELGSVRSWFVLSVVGFSLISSRDVALWSIFFWCDYGVKLLNVFHLGVTAPLFCCCQSIHSTLDTA